MHKIQSEVTGSVWKLEAAPGQVLREGDSILIIESMKMEIPVVCDRPGILRGILVAEGESVQEGQCVATVDCVI